MPQHSSLGLGRHSPNLFQALKPDQIWKRGEQASHKTNLNLGLLRDTSTLLFNSNFNKGVLAAQGEPFCKKKKKKEVDFFAYMRAYVTFQGYCGFNRPARPILGTRQYMYF